MTAVTVTSTAWTVDDEPVDLLATSPLRVAIMGTYRPTRCGIATYTESLRRSLTGDGLEVAVIRVLQEDDEDSMSPGVEGVFRPGDMQSLTETAAVLTGHDLAIVQHEFGIYGPGEGRAVIDLIDAAETPTLVTLHTVTDNPTREQHDILRRLVHRAARTVVHTDAARQILQDVYLVDAESVAVIPHGADLRLVRDTDAPLPDGGVPVLLTWGLIGPGKGLEWAVRAVHRLKETHPGTRYVIAGQTHPKVLAQQGEAYRQSIEELVAELDLGGNVEMVDRYLDEEELSLLIEETSVVVLPYESDEQTTSGVLSEAVSWGVPVVATKFPHALEMERIGTARTVPHRDPVSLAEAIEKVNTDFELAESMRRAQRKFALSSGWAQVGASYRTLAEEVMRSMAL